ncbi:uncharacterized protein METZ01_LOCUS269285, partial [marine metagenome]
VSRNVWYFLHDVNDSLHSEAVLVRVGTYRRSNSLDLPDVIPGDQAPQSPGATV